MKKKISLNINNKYILMILSFLILIGLISMIGSCDDSPSSKRKDNVKENGFKDSSSAELYVSVKEKEKYDISYFNEAKFYGYFVSDNTKVSTEKLCISYTGKYTLINGYRLGNFAKVISQELINNSMPTDDIMLHIKFDNNNLLNLDNVYYFTYGIDSVQFKLENDEIVNGEFISNSLNVFDKNYFDNQLKDSQYVKEIIFIIPCTRYTLTELDLEPYLEYKTVVFNEIKINIYENNLLKNNVILSTSNKSDFIVNENYEEYLILDVLNIHKKYANNSNYISWKNNSKNYISIQFKSKFDDVFSNEVKLDKLGLLQIISMNGNNLTINWSGYNETS